MCVAMWALTDFTADNGATRIVPGSHKADREAMQSEIDQAIAAEMPAGSVLVFHGSLWHSGGPNCTRDEWRLGVNVQFCQGYIRQQQNPYLGLSRDVVASFPERLRQLCGFTLYRGIMGHVDGASPGQVVLGDESLSERAYDKTRIAHEGF
jgi:ectoine hydroxylase-related dioxygenase (phytanoyl-CoA dioxygenase family)